jgi:hypothetical protein
MSLRYVGLCKLEPNLVCLKSGIKTVYLLSQEAVIKWKRQIVPTLSQELARSLITASNPFIELELLPGTRIPHLQGRVLKGNVL